MSLGPMGQWCIYSRHFVRIARLVEVVLVVRGDDLKTNNNTYICKWGRQASHHKPPDLWSTSYHLAPKFPEMSGNQTAPITENHNEADMETK